MKKLVPALKVIIAPFTAILLILCAFLSFRWRITQGLMTRAFVIMEDSAQQQISTIRARLDGIYDLLDTVAGVVSQKGGIYRDKPQTMSLMKMIANQTQLNNIALVDPAGNAFLTSGDTTNIADRQYFQESMAGQDSIERIESGKVDKAPHFLLSVPVHSGSNIIGVIFGSFDTASISDIFTVDVYGGEAFSFICDRDGKVVIQGSHKYYMEGLEDTFQFFTADNMLDGMTPQKLKEDLQRGESAAFAFLKGGAHWYVTYTPMDVGGWYMINAVPRTSVDQANRFIDTGALGMVAAILSVGVFMVLYTYFHEKRVILVLEAERALLRESETRAELLRKLSKEILFTGSVQRDELLFNERFSQLFGYEPAEHTLTAAGGARICPEDSGAWSSFLALIRSGAQSGSTELRVMNAHDQPVWQQMDFLSVETEGMNANSFIGKLSDIARQKQLLDELKKQAQSDPLTGLINRGAMAERTDALLIDGTRHGMTAFMMIDIDHFKQMNDTLGHQTGDEILRRFALCLNRLFRTSDLISRMGGDEFAVLMSNVGTLNAIRRKAGEICSSAGDCCKTFAEGFSVSVGVSLFSPEANNFETLYAHADQALYRAKALGKNRYCLYGDEDGRLMD